MLENEVKAQGIEALDKQRMFHLKRKGFSDKRLASLLMNFLIRITQSGFLQGVENQLNKLRKRLKYYKLGESCPKLFLYPNIGLLNTK